ncbi:uncharacterized protein LOC117121139, partial [Anneissia japonica]|uniref:uncharacterized protein LOC117121139 n=1 Tax=Anneissia japonica TaxID=1529436 RepID=UPI00142561EC
LESPYFEKCTDSFTVGTDPGLATAVVSWDEPVPIDKNGINRTVQNYYPNDMYNVSSYTVVYVAYDIYNNNAVCEFVITVKGKVKRKGTLSHKLSFTGSFTAKTVLEPVEDIVTASMGHYVTVDNMLHDFRIYAAFGDDGLSNTRPIVSSIGTYNYELAKCLSELIQPHIPEEYTVTDTFTFVKTIKDITATSGHFRFNKECYRKIDGVSMGSPLAPILANLFMGHNEKLWLTDKDCPEWIYTCDLEAPNITCPDNITVEKDPGNTTALVDWMVPVPTDNVELTRSSPVADPDRQPPTAIAITLESPQTYTATDTAGNSASCTFFITVEDIDKEPPLIANCPVDMNLSTSAGVNYTNATWTEPTVTDNAGTPNLTSTHSVGSEFYIGKTVVIYTAVDSFDNTATCNFTICVQDNEPPTFYCQESFKVNTTINSNATNVTWNYPTYMDNSYRDVRVIESHSIPTILVMGIHEVTYTFTDIYNNTDSCSFNITVIDNEPPTFDCQKSFEINTTINSNAANVTWNYPTYMDNSYRDVRVIESHSIPTIFVIGIHEVTYTFTDIYNNTDSCSFNITVMDVEDPNLECPSGFSVETDARSPKSVVTWKTSVKDNSGKIDINSTYSSGYAFPIGVTTVEYIVQDNSGNVDECSFNITVKDTEKPNLVCPNKVLTDKPNSVNWSIAEPEDNSGLEVTLIASAFPGVWEVGQHSVTYNATDVYGNLATCSFNVFVIDACGGGEKICVNGGVCSAIDFKCMCPTFYSGELCENGPEEPRFSVVPTPTEAALYGSISLTCNVSDSSNWQWYKDEVSLLATKNLHTITVKITIDNLGYYQCGGFGAGEHSGNLYFSNNVTLVANDIFVFPVALTYTGNNGGYVDDLKKPTSTAYKYQSSIITNFLSSLSLNDDLIIRVRSFSNGSIIAYVNVYVVNASTPYETLRKELRMTIGNHSNELLNVNSIVINSTETCHGGVYEGYTYPDAGVGETVNSTENCDDKKLNYFLPHSNRSCDGDGFSAAEWNNPIKTDCGPDATAEQLLERLKSKGVTMANVEDVSTEVENITSNAEEITVNALESTAEILKDILITGSNSTKGEIPSQWKLGKVIPLHKGGPKDKYFRIVIIVYNDSRLFQSAQFVNDSSGRRPNSQVISLSVPELINRTELDEPIVITFIPLESEGCTFVNGSADGSDRQYCECNHLTNFALLMDFYQKRALPSASGFVTTVGLGLSIVSLCATVFTFLSNKKFRRSDSKKILCQLCLSLLGLYIVFLAGIDRTNNSGGCTAVGALLHYFLLSSIFWMSVQAVNMYYLFVKVFNTHVPHFFLKACLFAWGLPVVIVLVSTFIDIDSYVDSKTHCFLTLQRMYYAVAVPVALSLLFNMIVFFVVLHNLGQLGKNTTRSHKIFKKKNKGMQMLQNGVSITIVLGLTWLIGFFAIGDASVIMLWLFCIFNSFQGFLIFIMYCVRNKEVRVHWREMICNGAKYTNGQSRRSSRKQRPFSNTPSHPSPHIRNHGDNNQVILGRRSFMSENINLRG